ncbi:hypothetical protein PIB30_055077 [Stylosanthes scabra]|uniref:Transposase, Ptta/En/Spm, plant n=1 Tax=Stylosanthes scabra TaxID=79078 RepID=A0ABU6QJC6_9FABA|nr:hypothetical protein [Stylosanthes scabra]
MDNTDTEDEDYVPGSDELESFDDHIDNLFAAHNVEQQQNVKKCNRNKPWKVDVIEDGKIRHLPHTVFEANSIPAGRKIVLDIDEYNQPVGEEPAYWVVFWWIRSRLQCTTNKPDGDVKEGILKKLGKNWKGTRSHLFNTFYDDTKSEDENVKKHKPPGIDPEHWRVFLRYRLSDDTQEKCKKNAENRAKQAYTHTGGSKTLARRREEEEAIKVIETCDPSTKELSQNDSLAQVLGKEHPGRLRGMGAGPCPTQMINRGTQQTNSASHMAVEEYERQIVELRAKNVEVEKKAQTLEDIVRYLVQQQGNNLPPMIDAKMNSLGSGASSTNTQDLHGPP